MNNLIYLQEEPKRPFVNDNNIIMYLDMINEKIVELKTISQFLDYKVIYYFGNHILMDIGCMWILKGEHL